MYGPVMLYEACEAKPGDIIPGRDSIRDVEIRGYTVAITLGSMTYNAVVTLGLRTPILLSKPKEPWCADPTSAQQSQTRGTA